MAITATFTADFEQFNSEVQQAEKQLDLFETSTVKAGQGIDKLSTSTTKAAPQVANIGNAYRQFDGILAAAGIHAGPAVKGIEDIASAAGTTAGQLGKLATAGLVVGTFVAAFKTTQMVMELTGLDKALGNNLAKWLGWGDVAKETALAVAESLAKASGLAERPITSMTDAIRIQTDDLKKRTEAAKAGIKATKEEQDAMNEVMVARQNWKTVIEGMTAAQIGGARAALEHGVAQTTVATAYKLSKSEIAAVVSLIDDEKERYKKLKEEQKAFAEQQAKNAEMIHKGWEPVGAVLDQVFGMEALRKATAWNDAMNTLGMDIDKLRREDLEELNQTMYAGIDALARSGQLTSAQSSAFAELAIQSGIALAALQPVVAVTEDLVKAQWDYVTALDEANAKQSQQTDEIKKTTSAAHELANRPAGGGLLPNAIAGKNGVAMDMFGRPTTVGGTLTNLPILNININSPLGTPDAIARAVGDAVTGSYRSGGQRMPV